MTTVSPSVAKPRMLPVVASSVIGTAIEWYDFFLYGTVATIVFPHLFFPEASVFAGTILSLTTFLVGFIARPIGAVIFGHLGDRAGRKSTLIVTLLLTGIATVAVGLTPAYTSIGILAPLLISLMRFCQGLGVGGEWGGSVLLALEYGHEGKRGFWASWPHVGLPLGLLLSSLAVALVQGLTGSQFETWGWRIPFFLSALLVLIGLYIRLRILETPLFTRFLEDHQPARIPVADVVRFHWKKILLSAGAKFAEQAPLYIFQTFILIYGATYLKLDKQVLLAGIYLGAFLEVFTIPLFSLLSDSLGRRLCYLAGCVVMLLFIFPYFLLLNTHNSTLVMVSIVLSFALCHGLVYGPQAALISEQFDTKLRYSGASLGYQLSAPFAGGLGPIIALTLLQHFGGSSVPVAFFLMGVTVFSFVCVLGLKEMSRASIEQ